MEGEWLCYEVVILMEGARYMLGGQFNGGRMVMLHRWSLIEGEWSCYRGGH